MDEDGVRRLSNAVAQAKQFNASGMGMGLAIYKAAENNHLNTDQLAREMAKRAAKRRKWLPKKKPYVRMPARDWMAEHEARQP
jgi:hypothetical protein